MAADGEEYSMIVKWLVKFFVALNGSSNPVHIGGAVAVAFLVACIPGPNPIAIAIIIAAFFTRINAVVMLVGIPILGLITPFLDGFFDRLGYGVLTFGGFSSAFAALSEIPLVPLTGCNNTIVMGGLLFGVVAFFPLLAGTVILVDLYRKKIRDRFAASRLKKAILAIPHVASMVNLLAKARSMYL
jgi:uncharacterized protein (TIGR03546 family)